MGKSGTPGSSFLDVGHTHLHDITFHGMAGTIPVEIVENGKNAYNQVEKFLNFVKDKYPQKYQQWSKNGLIENVESNISGGIDYSTAAWTHFVSSMKDGRLNDAFLNLKGRSEWGFLGNNSQAEIFKDAIYSISRIDDAKPIIAEFTKSFSPKMNVKPMPYITDDSKWCEYLYRRQLEIMKSIETSNF
jgi:hypothetical protein